MRRLTEKDDQGNWCLKGVRWEQLREGQVITKDVAERLYGALFKLKDYEDTGASPGGIADLIKNYARAMTLLAGQIEEHSWIPVEEGQPKANDYVLMSFSNIKEPAIGMYEENEWYLGDAYGGEKCINEGLLVNAWMPLPEPYKE